MLNLKLCPKTRTPRLFKLIFSVFLLTFGIFHLASKPASAVPKFSATYQITYIVNPSGTTTVRYQVSQKNNLSIVYATEFSISVNQTQISNIRVADFDTLVRPDIIKTTNQTTISFPFKNKIVGKENAHQFTIEYDTTDITTKHGSTWQINIPKLETNENIASQTVILQVPDNFPAPAYIEPKPDVIKGNLYYFSDKRIVNKSISAVFGKAQFFDANLSYHLQNQTNKKVIQEIALPPDTSYQSVYIKNIIPKPLTTKQDQDGNWLAEYELSPNTNLDVTLEAIIKLELNPKTEENYNSETYLLSNEIWDFDSSVYSLPEFKNLTTPRIIYDYVVDKFTYDYRKIIDKKSGKVSSSESLKNASSAICTDFTNTFVALARKAFIPARELEGFALSENPDLKPLSLEQDILHAWPEYYDGNKKTWIQIDPTWANTTKGIDYFNKLDFNHIVFAIHGTNPSLPIPAGGYKNNESKKDITITPIEEINIPNPQIDLLKVRQNKNEITFVIQNTSGAYFDGPLTIEENGFIKPAEQNIKLMPFEKTEVKSSIKNITSIAPKSTPAIIYINGQKLQQIITIYPIATPLIFAGAGIILATIAIIARNIYLRRRRKNPPVHW